MMTSNRVILIGGGEIAERETLTIDRQFLELAGGEKAIIGFFPTAADDSDRYITTFINYFNSLGCQEIIPLKLSELTANECKKLIGKVRGIYLGGGNTKTLIEIFRKESIDVEIERALDRGAVLVGMSAGALAACDYYIDPDMETENQEINEGLGFQHKILCIVHYQPNKIKDKLALFNLKREFPNYDVVGIKEKKAIFVNGDTFRWLG